jgi:hypothetical protein
LAKAMARNEQKEIIDKFIIKIAHINCKKDTYHVLRDTVTHDLNCDLKLLTKGKKKMCLYKKIDEETYTIQIKDSNYTHDCPPSFVCPYSNKQLTDTFVFIHACKINLCMTGDLAYYVCALGKINMSGIWCTWCKLSSDQWSEMNHVRGKL